MPAQQAISTSALSHVIGRRVFRAPFQLTRLFIEAVLATFQRLHAAADGVFCSAGMVKPALAAATLLQIAAKLASRSCLPLKLSSDPAKTYSQQAQHYVPERDWLCCQPCRALFVPAWHLSYSCDADKHLCAATQQPKKADWILDRRGTIAFERRSIAIRHEARGGDLHAKIKGSGLLRGRSCSIADATKGGSNDVW